MIQKQTAKLKQSKLKSIESLAPRHVTEVKVQVDKNEKKEKNQNEDIETVPLKY